MKIKFANRLQTKFLALIILAMLILPMAFPLTSLFVYLPAFYMKGDSITTYNASEIEELWHSEARQLADSSRDEIITRLQEIQRQYLESSVFMIGADGHLIFRSSDNQPIPSEWDVGTTIQFMKESVNGDPYTVVSFLGEPSNSEIIIFQIPRYLTEAPINQLSSYLSFIYLVIVAMLLLLFLFLTWLFFKKMVRRLVLLQESMKMEDQRIPAPVSVGEKDEVGQLELSFNSMIEKLNESREREKQEETLRRELIANLSHDLRTPLATIRAHNYSLENELLSAKGKQATKAIDGKIDFLDKLIENLLSYTLLTAGKYTYKPKQTDMNRVIRSTLASWYPIFEKEQFEIEIDLDENVLNWEIDPHWFERILDNLFQNVIRHAKSGKYISISNRNQAIAITDKGPGLKEKSDQKGVGIGLSIVDLMAKEMKLDWKISSDQEGTTIIFRKE